MAMFVFNSYIIYDLKFPYNNHHHNHTILTINMNIRNVIIPATPIHSHPFHPTYSTHQSVCASEARRRFVRSIESPGGWKNYEAPGQRLMGKP